LPLLRTTLNSLSLLSLDTVAVYDFCIHNNTNNMGFLAKL